MPRAASIRRLRLGHILALLCIAATAGCAQNQVRLEYAGSVASESKNLVESANAYVAGIQQRRREANIALLADNPSCRWGPSIKIDMAWSDPNKGLCDLTGVPVDRQLEISLRPISDDALKGIATAIAGVAAYQGALTEVLDEKPIDAKLALDEGIKEVTQAAGDLTRISGGKVDFSSLIKPLGGDQVGALTTLIGTLVELQQTQMKVDEVGKVVSKHDSGQLFTALDAESGKLSTLYDAATAERMRDSLSTAYDKAVPQLDFDKRREWLRQIAAADDEVVTGRADRLGMLKKAIAELRKTDTSLRDALNGKYSPEVRRRIARDNRKAILGLLTQIAAVFPAVAAA